MKLSEIYAKKITREINPAVTVGNFNQDTVTAEIDEYVFTDEILEKLYEILDTVINRKKGKTGIWINGYYGSGKSHFIKYVHYCLNAETSELAFQHFIDGSQRYDTTKVGKHENVTPSNINLLKKRAQAVRCDHIMFNVEDVTDDGSGERLTRIFLSMFNKFRGYNSHDLPTGLLLEKYLDHKGKYAEFIELVKTQLDHDWRLDAADLVAYELDSVLEIAKSLIPSLDTVALHAKLSNPETYRITINDTLIPEFKEFLKDKPEEYRLLFLVDEVSQYVGSNKEILLNFQNIIERVSEECNNQVWIACTAQQTLEDVSSGTGTGDFRDEFGKILGRFDTRISLESNDAAFITQKRVLEKNAKGSEALNNLYKTKKDAIENQFKMRHDLYKGFKEQGDFELAYPFVPYQFKLIADVFQQFQNLGYVIKEVKNNERSVLGITHFTAKEWADREVGKFIPFDAFYNKQFSTNLTQRGRNAIENAFNISMVKADAFATRVVKTLFMVSNLPDASRVTFPSNVDNLTILMMEDVDENKLALQNKIKTVIEKLLEENIIREEKGAYFFFNQDEMDVQMMIRSKNVGLHEKVDYFDELFRKVLNVPVKFTFSYNDFAVRYQVDDKKYFQKGDFGLILQLFDTTKPEDRALANINQDIVVCLSEWFVASPISKDFTWYCQTLKYFTTDGQDVSGDRMRTLENFRIRNEELKRRLVSQVSDKFNTTRFISGNEVIDASEVTGSQPAERIKNIITKHLDKIYKHHKLAGSYAQTAMELRVSAASTQLTILELTAAEEMVNNFITQHGNELSVEDIVTQFSKPPFGWRDVAIIDMLTQLVKKKKRDFTYRNDPNYGVVEFVNKAVSMAERSVCIVKSGEEISQVTIDQAAKDFRQIFNMDLPDTSEGKELFDNAQAKLKQLSETYQMMEEEYYGAYPFGIVFHELHNRLSRFLEKRKPSELFKLLSDEANSMKVVFDKAKGVKDFTDRMIKDYETIKDFHRENSSNFKALSIAAQEQADKMDAFLRSEEPQHDFRHIRKGYDELKKELKDLVVDLQEDLIKLYESAFGHLEAEAKKRDITEPHIYADKETTLQQVEKIKNITDLELKKSEISNWESEQLQKIVAHVAAKNTKPGQVVQEPESYYVKRAHVISNEQDLEEYLKLTRQDLLNLLKTNKTIIIK